MDIFSDMHPVSIVGVCVFFILGAVGAFKVQSSALMLSRNGKYVNGNSGFSIVFEAYRNRRDVPSAWKATRSGLLMMFGGMFIGGIFISFGQIW